MLSSDGCSPRGTAGASVSRCFGHRGSQVAVRVVVTDAREIDAEWRLFVVEGKVVSGSMYRPSAERSVPPEAIQFAERAASRWAPAPVFVMDVARVDRTWKIVECNCFNGSRFYESNVDAIVAAVSQYQAKRHESC